MTPDEEVVEAVFEAALACPQPDLRRALIEARCGADSELHRRVERLLAAHQAASGFLAEPVADLKPLWPETPTSDTDPAGESVEPAAWLGRLIDGRYLLEAVLGEGGMGTVYRAQQVSPVRRTVALKLLTRSCESIAVAHRFALERQALARMDHPHIARVLDGGATDDGRLYFVMELVAGPPITRFCDERRLTVRERVALLIDVCEAVQHAHQRGIIHRDLKPANVLVTLEDGRPRPRIIDFGVAKAIETPLANRTLATGLGAIVGTLEYMSPEQARLDPRAVDTRTDVHALGLLLFELLTGSVPFEGPDRSEGLLELLRRIEQEPAVRPSLRLSQDPDSARIADCRATRPDRLVRALRNQLDWVVLKALEKSPDRRYASPRELADDLRRVLEERPVRARAVGPFERFTRTCRRHPVVSALSVTAVSAVLLGLAASTYFALVASRRADAEQNARLDERRQRDRAEQQTARALLSEARALRGSNRSGQRFNALRALTTARDLTGPTRELADEAAAALCLPDWEVEFEWPGYPPDTEALALAPDFQRYARVRNGSVEIRTLPEDRLIDRFEAPGRHHDYGGLRFSRDGRLLLEVLTGAEPSVRVFRLDGVPAVRVFEMRAHWVDASPDSNQVAIAHDREIEIWDTRGGGRIRTVSVAETEASWIFRWHPTRPLLILNQGTGWRTLDLENGQLGPLRELGGTLNLWPAIHANGQWLTWSITEPPHPVLTVDLETGKPIGTPFRGHQDAGVFPAWGGWAEPVLTTDWQHVLRMWETTTGRPLLARLSQSGKTPMISEDNRRFGPELVGQSVRILRFHGGAEHARVALAEREDVRLGTDQHLALAPSGRLIAATTEQGLALIDPRARVPVGFWPSRGIDEIQVVRFLEDGSLITMGWKGWTRWPIQWEDSGRTARFLTPDRSLSGLRTAGTRVIWPSVSGDGKVISIPAAANPGGAYLMRSETLLSHGPNRWPRVLPGADVRSVSVSPDGRYLATGVHSAVPSDPGHSAQVWDTLTGESIIALESRELCAVRFSPQGRYLVAHSGDTRACTIFEVGSWATVGVVSSNAAGLFSPDERLFVYSTGGDLVLCHGSTMEEFARLPGRPESNLVPLFLTPEPTTLFTRDGETGQLEAWDLAQIRRGLAELGLASGWPDLGEAAEHPVRPAPVLVVLPPEAEPE